MWLSLLGVPQTMAPAITHMNLSIAKYVKTMLISPIWSNNTRCSLSIALLFLDWYYFVFWIGNYDLKHHSLKWQIHISWSSSKCFASHRFQLPFSGLKILTSHRSVVRKWFLFSSAAGFMFKCMSSNLKLVIQLESLPRLSQMFLNSINTIRRRQGLDLRILE